MIPRGRVERGKTSDGLYGIPRVRAKRTSNIATLDEWTEWLWPALFADANGERRPLTILHVDDALFARAAREGGHDLGDGAARVDFLAAFPPRPVVQRWLGGSTDPGGALLPLLILCCLAASEANDSDENDYRRRLRDLMGWSDAIFDCKALPRLWTRLARETDRRAETGTTRPLVLPDPKHRKQIGHAIELTFPSRNDARRLHALLERVDLDLDAPAEVLSWLAPHIARGHFSPTFEATFASFRRAWLDAERGLADHRFWCGWRVATARFADQEEAGIEIIADEWGARHLVRPGTTEPIDLERALRASALPSSLTVAARQTNAIPLTEAEWGRLRWAGRRPARAPVAFLVRERAFTSRLAALACLAVAGAEGWGLTRAAGIIARENDARGNRDHLIEVRVLGCHRVDGAILARPAFPFFLDVAGPVANLSLEGALAPELRLERSGHGRWKMTPLAPLSGDVTIVLTPTGGESAPRRQLRLARSVLAPSFRSDLPARLFERNAPPSAEWPSDHPTPTTATLSDTTVGNIDPSPLLDLTELLARRTAPLPMGDALAWAREAAGPGGPSPWDIVEALADAGAIRILETRGWRGRYILSASPRGGIIRAGPDYALLFEGLLGESFLARLEAACDDLALEREARAGFGAWSPDTQIVRAEAPAPLRELATRLGARVGYTRPDAVPFAALRLGEPLADAKPRGVQRAVPLTGRHRPVFLVDAERPDVPPSWLVRDGTRATLWRDREDAILEAYRRGGGRPFTLLDGRMVARDARLPRPVARWIRLVTGRAAGPCDDGYAYGWSALVERALPSLAPLVEGAGGGEMDEAGWRHARRWPMMAAMNGHGVAARVAWRWARERTR